MTIGSGYRRDGECGRSKSSGGSATQFPVKIGDRCIIGPHAYVVGATIGAGCFIASGSRVFNGAVMEDGSGVALGGIVHINAHRAQECQRPDAAHRLRQSRQDRAAREGPEVARDLQFYENVFNIDSGEGARAKAAQTYAQFLRKTHAQDTVLDAHANKAPVRRSAAKSRRKQHTSKSTPSSTR